MPDANLTYGAAAVTQSGRGVIAFTVVGPNDYPSAGYAGLDAKLGAGDVHIAAAGAGPWDGFTGIPYLGGGRPRWGDYGAASADGNMIWIASEYIAQTCTLSRIPDRSAVPVRRYARRAGQLGDAYLGHRVLRPRQAAK